VAGRRRPVRRGPLPETRNGEPAFEHHPSLPALELGGAVATVLVGELDGARSSARADTPLLGVDLAVHAPAVVPLDPSFEHAVVVPDGVVEVDGVPVAPGGVAYLGEGRDELLLGGRGRALLLGGTPFPEPILMWWNFVARTTDEMDEAYRQWQADGDRFGEVHSPLDRIDAPPPTWRRQ
jgi:quercetin 2,3-dioxygenase